MQIIKIKNGAYEEYEMLLLQRDQYRKEAAQILISYTRLFGDRINKAFEEQIACIRLRKTIELCQAALNHGESIDMDRIEELIKEQMESYYTELKRMLADTQAAKEAGTVSSATAQEVKRIYRKLAKQIHPDINPESRKSPQLMDLWNRIVIAYESNDLREIRELEVLTAAALDQICRDITIDIPNLEDKIASLKSEIAYIINSAPYIYDTYIKDPNKRKEKETELEKQLQEYQSYREQLQRILDDRINQGGGRITWRMNLH